MNGLKSSTAYSLITSFFFISNTFLSNARLKLAKIKQKLSNTLKLNFSYLKIIRFLHPPKIIGDFLKNVQKNKYVCLIEVIWLKTMKMRMKNTSHRYDIARLRPRHGQKYTIYKMCLNIMMAISIKQHVSNIWSSIYEKLSNSEAELKKSVACKEKRVPPQSISRRRRKLTFNLDAEHQMIL